MIDPDTLITCPCTEPGYCSKYNMYMTASWIKLCQTRPNYRQAWEEGRGPGQLRSNGQSRPGKVIVDGPGTELSRILKMFGIFPKGCCKCGSRAHTMNIWGPDRCEENIDKILKWLREEAKKRHLPFVEALSRRLVLWAISKSRRKIALKEGSS